MKPVLFHVASNIPVRSNEFMLVIAGLAGIAIVLLEMRRVGEKLRKILPLLVLLLISTLYGARLLYWIDFRDIYHFSMRDMLVFWKGGTALYGGGILAFLVYVIYTIWQRLDFWKILDVLAPSAFLFIFFARIGCFLMGCCHGRQCIPGFPFAYYRRFPSETVPADTPLYPTQLAFSASALFIFVLLWARRRRKAFDGEISLTGALLFALTSFLIEFCRGDLRILYPIDGTALSQNQVISVAVFLASAGLYLHRRGTRGTHRDAALP